MLGLLGGVVPALLITVRRDPDGTFWQQGSWLAALVVVGTIPLRFGLRYPELLEQTAVGIAPYRR